MFHPASTLTIENAKTTLEAGLRAIEGGQAEFDLAQLGIVDSAAVATLVAWKRAAIARRQPLAFRNIPPSLHSLVRLYGLTDLLYPAAPDAKPGADLSSH
jgi:phospholipid transport system transporter-binding protein